MELSLKQYQSLNISASATFSTAQGRENERREWTKETYLAKNKEPGNRYDWSRKHLNFEIKRGDKIGMKNGKPVFSRPTIIPIGTQTLSLKERYELRLKELNFKPWKNDAPNQPNTCVDFVLSGDHERMTEIAFGRPMDFDWSRDNSAVTLADDPDTPGYKQIETMAMDYYEFLCRKFGEENVIGLMCHLDETTPHFHALVIPVAERVKRGRVGGYELDPNMKSDDNDLSEHITTRQFSRLSEDKQKYYKPAEKKMALTVSYSHYFGETKFAESQSFKKWHDMLHNEVNFKWGLERGEDTSLMTAEERKEHRKKNKRQLERERLLALKEAQEAKEKANDARAESIKALKELHNDKQTLKETKEQLKEKESRLYETQRELDLNGSALQNIEENLSDGRRKMAELRTAVDSARKERDDVKKEKTELEKKVEELANAIGDPREVADVKTFDQLVFSYNPNSKGVIITNLKAKGKTEISAMDVIMAAFEERDKVKDQKKSFWEDANEFKKKQAREIKSIITDMQSILRSFDSVRVKDLTERSRALVKQEIRQNAIAMKKIQQYDEMGKKGITVELYEKAKEKADKFDEAYTILESMWRGAWDAIRVIINPRLDEYVMNNEEKETIRKALRENPKDRLVDAGVILKVVGKVREIADGTKSEIYQLGAESGVNYLKNIGLELAEGIVDDASKVAATTACLFFGFADAATTISQSCGGGGCGNSDLPKKKDDEDNLAFAKRCHQIAQTMHAPRYRLRR